MSAILTTDRIVKQFGMLRAVSNVSLEIMEGEIYGIIGPNGAGKTTFFNVISGFDSPTTGEVVFRGKKMTGKGITEYCINGLARTFQNIRVFNEMTVLENLQVGMHKQVHSNMFGICLNTGKQKNIEKESEEKAHEIMRFLGIEKFAEELAGSLPYGTQRLVEIGRAMASEPKLLLLDEPSAGMNQQETIELMELIHKIRERGPTIIVIEHNMHFIMNLCHRIAVLCFGELLMVGTPEEVQKNPDVIEAYLGSGED